MFSLHKVTEETKLIFKWLAIGISTAVLLVVLFRVGGNVKEYFFPTPPAPPTVTFGILPAIPFPENSINKKLTYSLDTVAGTFPALPDRATVFETQKRTPNLLDLKNAQEKVKNVDFRGEEIPVGQSLYRWNDTTNRTLTFNIVTSNFTLTSNFLSSPNLLTNKQLPDETQAKEQAERFLTNMQLFPIDIDRSKTKVTYLTANQQKITAATSRSNANIAKVDFFQSNLEGLPIYYPNPAESLLQVLLTGGSFESKIIEATFTYTPVSEVSATYPIISSEQAYEKLQKGEANNVYVASYFGSTDIINIKNISLGYFIGSTNQAYVYPIIVFEGNNGFVAYVSAVNEDWIRK